jgi:hypothetical protein
MTPIAITIVGTTPLLCGRPVPDDPGPDPGDPRVQAAARLYLGAGGEPVIPGLNLFRCFAGAVRLQGRCPVELVNALGLAERELPIRSERPWAVDSRMVCHPGTGLRSICHRPRFDAWQLDGTLLIDRDLWSPVQVRGLITDAGLRVGLGDFRPERGGPFGRFTVGSWEPL